MSAGRKEGEEGGIFRWDTTRKSILRQALHDMFGLTENDRGLLKGLTLNT